MSQAGPRNLLKRTFCGQTKETAIQVVHPQISLSILGEGKHALAGNATQNKATIFKVADPAGSGDPDSPTRVLKKCMWSKSIEFTVRFGAAGLWNRELSILPPVQATSSSEPNTSIPVSKNGRDAGVRQTLLRSQRDYGKFAKAIETFIGSDPKIALTVLKNGCNACAREAIRSRKHIRPSLVYVNEATVTSSDPKSATAAAEHCG